MHDHSSDTNGKEYETYAKSRRNLDNQNIGRIQLHVHSLAIMLNESERSEKLFLIDILSVNMKADIPAFVVNLYITRLGKLNFVLHARGTSHHSMLKGTEKESGIQMIKCGDQKGSGSGACIIVTQLLAKPYLRTRAKEAALPAPNLAIYGSF